MNQVGKRFKCDGCGSEALITKPGAGQISCCDAPMQLIVPKKTASAD